MLNSSAVMRRTEKYAPRAAIHQAVYRPASAGLVALRRGRNGFPVSRAIKSRAQRQCCPSPALASFLFSFLLQSMVKKKKSCPVKKQDTLIQHDSCFALKYVNVCDPPLTCIGQAYTRVVGVVFYYHMHINIVPGLR